MLIKRGAEAEIRLIEWYGRKAVSKLRIAKPYRNEMLDASIRRQRTLHEAHLLHEAKIANVSTPNVYFVDPKNAEIIMEYIDGSMLKNVLNNDLELSKRMGELTAKLHMHDIIHGDLTTSNFLVQKDRLVLIDFGLAFKSKRIEDKAVDIRLIKEALSSAHVNVFDQAFGLFLEGYKNVAKDIEQLLRKVKEIEMRGRYARVV